MSTLEPSGEHELVVAEDGSIPADQLASLGLRPGAHLRVSVANEPADAPCGLAGSLPDLPDIDWDDFERASDHQPWLTPATSTLDDRPPAVSQGLANGSTTKRSEVHVGE